jgi:Domain of unknown function (DUF4365)
MWGGAGRRTRRSLPALSVGCDVDIGSRVEWLGSNISGGDKGRFAGYDPVVGDLYLNFRKEYFSLAYVEALAYTAGYAVEHAKVDVYGVDFEMRDGAFRVDVQMKCVTADPHPGPNVAFDLDVRTYGKLTDPRRNVPAYLFLLEVDPDIDRWVDCRSEGIRLFKSGYYADMSILGETSNSSTQRVQLSRGNRLTVESLDKLMRESDG